MQRHINILMKVITKKVIGLGHWQLLNPMEEKIIQVATGWACLVVLPTDPTSHVLVSLFASLIKKKSKGNITTSLPISAAPSLPVSPRVWNSHAASRAGSSFFWILLEINLENKITHTHIHPNICPPLVLTLSTLCSGPYVTPLSPVIACTLCSWRLALSLWRQRSFMNTF